MARLRAIGVRPLTIAGLVAAAGAVAGTAAAHGGGVSGASRDPVELPVWLFLATGGGVVGASFLLASFVTDRTLVERLHRVGATIAVPDRLVGSARAVLGAVGAVALLVVLVGAFLGPTAGTRNPAVLLVWVGWWAGMPMVVYGVGNVWPLVNPWRALTEWSVAGRVRYPARLGAWPSVAGLLALGGIEIVSPVAEDPRLLGSAIVAYSVVTVAGALAFGPGLWFRRVDPIARVFGYYGRFAPVSWDGGLRVSWPGSRLVEADLVDGADEVAFVIALLWVTTYDGLVSTPTWAGVTRAVVGAGVPPTVAYLGTLVVGFAVFLGAHWLGTSLARDCADTRESVETIRQRFAPTLLPIAVGYHLAHFLGYFLSLYPSLTGALANPVEGIATPQVFVLPPVFGGLSIAAVLLGHVLAIWVAHATAFDLFPGRLQAIRSQYPIVAVMVGYTMTSLWIVTRPSVTLPYL